ncbi:maleylpyruvate isomerase N-terminal domain-containing protein [Mycobacterium sp. OTB74]|jgi:hypothetical protein|uniref:maleylpyruvate isomerase N-terminal domain-containing protein n=1 Tax=Mycobacterium sp. OTB74 TaxID=1853452 RepID=UPI002473572E|nr:maleylpyruvate isomerase N-terminal domain-containing protein [Mycobacterium sp. OTB74]MDH6246652.1 hypothetical protein [Mycobacterium sp. OTB74]
MDNDGFVPLVDTSRDELRERIALAGNRFDTLVRDTDPRLQPRRSHWTVQQTVAHVVTLGRRYQQVARGGEYRHAVDPADIANVNQSELEAAIAPIPELADELLTLSRELEGFFDANTNDQPTLPFHGFGMMSGNTAQTNWLGEFLLHGEDIAKTAGTNWELTERDMALVLRGAREMAPLYLRADIPANVEVCVAVEIPDARPYLLRIDHGAAEMRERRPTDRPDAIVRVPASTMTQLLYQRIGQLSAIGRGLRMAGGRRPWRALKLMTYFQRP